MFEKFSEKLKATQQEWQTAKDDRARDHAGRAEAAGRLVTSGAFGTTTVELYEGGYARIALPGRDATAVSTISKKTPYEKLLSATFTGPESEWQPVAQPPAGGIEGAVGQVVTAVFKGSSAAMKTTIPGLAATGVSHLAKSMTYKATLTIVTDKAIHTITNVVSNSVGVKIPKADHIEAGRVLAATAAQILGLTTPGPAAEAQTPDPLSAPASQTVSDRLRELVVLHSEGVLGDDEFATAKARLLSEF
ncbi:SHOCT domain-containing protein [Isoptericola sp. 4D.3]|uniref:SHOCT domain-containing protein n=1 Tax=Isoptericola peretonis TaxID=2918523 RepID=A0ABT0J8Y5_9MICO|nr:SHOCT domain-containing protein [Isoptericola sp. 4D.3]